MLQLFLRVDAHQPLVLPLHVEVGQALPLRLLQLLLDLPLLYSLLPGHIIAVLFAFLLALFGHCKFFAIFLFHSLRSLLFCLLVVLKGFPPLGELIKQISLFLKLNPLLILSVPLALRHDAFTLFAEFFTHAGFEIFGFFIMDVDFSLNGFQRS